MWLKCRQEGGRFRWTSWAELPVPPSCCCRRQVASVVSDSVRPHRQQPTRLLRPWDSPGMNPGVGCISFSTSASLGNSDSILKLMRVHAGFATGERCSQVGVLERKIPAVAAEDV